MLDAGMMSVKTVVRLTVEEMMQVGLSRRKAEYMIGIAKEITSGRLNIQELASLPGEDVQARLVAIRGIGAWTADNFRLFALADMDAWPVNDVALQEAMRRLKSLEAPGRSAGSWRGPAPIAAPAPLFSGIFMASRCEKARSLTSESAEEIALPPNRQSAVATLFCLRGKRHIIQRRDEIGMIGCDPAHLGPDPIPVEPV